MLKKRRVVNQDDQKKDSGKESKRSKSSKSDQKKKKKDKKDRKKEKKRKRSHSGKASAPVKFDFV
jgi:hypothetical protein